MQRLQHYLRNNKTLDIIHKKIFNNKPMTIDHLAHRSFNNDNVSVEYTSKFNNFRWMSDKYNFKQHNAYAYWLDNYREPNQFRNNQNDERIIGTPKLFISTYRGVEYDFNLKDLTSNEKYEIVECIKHREKKISYDFYKKINEINQYLAWTLVHRNNVNHIAILVDDIFDTLKKVIEIIPVNNPVAPVQISEDRELLQFSTKSENRATEFSDGEHEVPVDFVEFIERKNRRNGFSEKNANIIFNSTKL